MKTFMCIIAACVLVSRADAQAPTTNAALRYWMAFAVMHDPPAGQATAELLDRIAAGTAPWDEAKLGKLLDDNREALKMMQRATKLATCDWGLEYDLGPNTPIAHLAKARVMGRLNALEGARQASGGQFAQAVDVWLAGAGARTAIGRAPGSTSSCPGTINSDVSSSLARRISCWASTSRRS